MKETHDIHLERIAKETNELHSKAFIAEGRSRWKHYGTMGSFGFGTAFAYVTGHIEVAYALAGVAAAHAAGDCAGKSREDNLFFRECRAAEVERIFERERKEGQAKEFPSLDASSSLTSPRNAARRIERHPHCAHQYSGLSPEKVRMNARSTLENYLGQQKRNAMGMSICGGFESCVISGSFFGVGVIAGTVAGFGVNVYERLT